MHVCKPRGNLALTGLVALVIVLITPLTAFTQQATPNGTPGVAAANWQAVAQALGAKGQLMAGDVFRVSMPRTDLHVTVAGVPVKAGLALGSYAAFKHVGDKTAVMGDLVLLDKEVNPVMSGLFAQGLTITALHNHLLDVTPHVMYLHFAGSGDAIHLATAIRQALAASGTPLGQQPSGAASPVAGQASAFDTSQIAQILGHQGKLNNGVFSVSVPRAETITMTMPGMSMRMEVPPAMGVATSMAFQQTGEGKVATTGDFVLIAREVNPVAQALRAHGIEVEALHNHSLDDEPRLFYMHFWGYGDPATLAQGLRAALDQTNSKQG